MESKTLFFKYMFGSQFVAAIFFLALFGLTLTATGQTTIVNYAFNDAASGTPCVPGTSNTALGITASVATSTGTCNVVGGIASGVGAFTANATPGNSVSVTGFGTGATQSVDFQLGGGALPAYSSFKVYFQTLRSGTGPTSTALQYSINGSAFTTFGAAVTNPSAAPWGVGSFDLSAVPAFVGATSITFRLLASGGSNASGTFRVDNFQVQGVQLVTAATVTVTGRALNQSGRGISGVRVRMTDSNGNVRYSTTNPFGNYQFTDVEVGGLYVVEAFSKRYTFANPYQVISVSDAVTNLDFVSIGSASRR